MGIEHTAEKQLNRVSPHKPRTFRKPHPSNGNKKKLITDKN